MTFGGFARKGHHLKWLLCLAFFGLIRLNAAGQEKADGTIIVINSANNEIVFAADTRTAFGDSYTDDSCKIRAFGDKVLFAASGRDGVRDKRTHVYLWNANTIAKNLFLAATKKGASTHLTEQLASSWGIAVKEHLERDIVRDKKVALSGMESDGTMTLGANQRPFV
jgi:hypothetical protein